MDKAGVAATSLGFRNLVINIDFALEYPSEVKDNPSNDNLTFGISRSFGIIDPVGKKTYPQDLYLS